MSLSVELTPDMVAQIQRNVVTRVTEELTRDVVAQLNARQIVAEIKNGVVARIADKMAAELKVRHKVDEALHRAVQSAESRVQTYIQKRLSQGVVVRFGDLA